MMWTTVSRCPSQDQAYYYRSETISNVWSSKMSKWQVEKDE
jgi:spore germination cell wall hydrolase CwlJ-like protein